MDIDAVAVVWERYKGAQISTEIHIGDEMYRTGPGHYYTIGQSAIRAILPGLATTWLPNVQTILDLPCGYGRVARHLRQAFPDAAMTFCDIEKAGVDFCAEQFNGKGVYSDPDMRKVNLPKNQDLIWIGSLFTHLDEARTRDWLAYLAQHLSPHGILVATFHGLFFPELLKSQQNVLTGADWPTAERGLAKTGYGYSPYPTDTYGDFGISVASPAKLLEIATGIPDTRVVSYTERGWGNNHDVLILCRHDRLKPFSAYAKA